MRRKGLRILLWVLLTPIALLVLMAALLYVPPVQSLIRSQATAIASEATGMEITVERIDLRFPLNLLVRGIKVKAPLNSPQGGTYDSLDNISLPFGEVGGAVGEVGGATLLSVGSLNIKVQALPLLRGEVEVDDITLEGVSVNSGELIEGMQIVGELGNFSLQSHGIDLLREDVTLNSIALDDTHVTVILTDTTETEEDTTALDLNWRIALHSLRLKNVSVDLQMPLDSMQVVARIGSAGIEDADIDLGRQSYGWRKFLLEEGQVDYGGNLTTNHLSLITEKESASSAAKPASEKFDGTEYKKYDVSLRDIRLGIDSVLYCGRQMNAVIRECSMYEQSGLSVTSLTGRLMADSTLILIPQLKLTTPHSEVDFTAQTYWELINIPTTGHLSARLDARIGKEDVLILAGDLPDSFKRNYPFRPLTLHAGTEGNLKEMQVSRFTADLPGAFALNGGGEFYNLNDSLRRSGSMDFEMQTMNLNFLAGLADIDPTGGEFVVPDSMRLAARVALDGNECTAAMKLREGEGRLNLDAAYNLASEAYRADLAISDLQLHHFLPRDSIYTLSMNIAAHGQGTDFFSPKSRATLTASLNQLKYGHWDVSGIGLRAGLQSSVATLDLTSDNPLLRMQTRADMRLDRKYLDGTLDLKVDEVNFYELGMVPKPLKRPFAFTLGAEARHDSVKLQLDAGDLDFRFRSRSTLKKMMQQGEEFVTILSRQLEERKLDHAELRRALPSAGINVKAGKENPVGYFLAAKGIYYDDFKLNFGFTPQVGINGRTAIHGLHTDSLQLDTIFFTARQDTARMKLQGGIINGPRNPQFVFSASLTGEIRNEDAELTVDYVNGKGETGILFGINARALTEGHGRGNGLLLRLIPEEPVIAYRKFQFADKSDWIYLHKNMRVYANVDMESNDGLCFRMQSDRTDTLSLQNINVELSRLRLEELVSVIPYMPRMTGLFSAEAHYIQTATSLQATAEANIQQLTYERQPVGNIGLGATYLPGEQDKHYLNGYFTYNDEEVMTADGRLSSVGGRDTLQLLARLEHFPLKMANAFIPDQMVSFTGDMDGEISINGDMEKPRIEGEVKMDSVSLYARQAGARYWFDNRPVQIRDNQLLFDKFAIYTTSKTPFTIDGKVDFRNLEQPTANLNLLAENYTLLDAPRTRESLVYGKVYVDLKATVKGPLDGLTMRGQMNLLGNTNVTYVMTNTPLMVEDRLDGLVTFTSFTDTTTVATAEEMPVMSLGGLEMYMSVHIDDAVRLRADLSPDRSKFIELEGGGDLNMQYTPQGDINLTGRYTLSGGTMKYSLPIIPLKEFSFTAGSYVDWRGDIMNPTLDLKATERMRASVSDGDDGASRMVNFDISISIKNKLESPDLIFDITAPEDATVENELQAMGAEERSKQAIAMLATGIYLNSGVKGGGLSMGAALNSVLQSQINSLAGGLNNASFSVGIEDRTSAETGDTQKDFSFRYSQRFFNDRVQIIIGGKVSTGANATNDAESFIDNISLEYRLDASGTRYVRAFYNKNYESILDGEITETGVGLVMRKKMDRLSELFIFRRRKKN